MMPEGVENFSKLEQTFDFIDYAVFALMLIVCLTIGLYFGYEHSVKKNANATLDYLLGGKNVQLFPGTITFFAVSKNQKLLCLVAMSQVASFVSGITLLGTSTEIYIYGTQYAFILGAPMVMGFFLHFVIIPVFHGLKVVSIYEVNLYRAYLNFQTRLLSSQVFA